MASPVQWWPATQVGFFLPRLGASSMTMLEIRDQADVVVATILPAKILDEMTIRKLGEEFKTLTTQAAADRRLLLNFERVSFMSSSMIGQVMLLSRYCKNDKVTLKLCSISPSIMEIFNLMRLNKVFDIYPGEPQALAAFGAPKRHLY